MHRIHTTLLLGRPHDAVALLKAALGDAANQKAIGQGGSVTLRLSLLALAYHCSGQLDQAAKLLCAPGAIGQLTGPDGCLFCLRRGHVLLAQRRYDEAVAAYRQALVHSPDDALALEAVAWASHLAPGAEHDPKAERKTYTELLRRDPCRCTACVYYDMCMHMHMCMCMHMYMYVISYIPMHSVRARCSIYTSPKICASRILYPLSSDLSLCISL